MSTKVVSIRPDLPLRDVGVRRVERLVLLVVGRRLLLFFTGFTVLGYLVVWISMGPLARRDWSAWLEKEGVVVTRLRGWRPSG